MQRLPVSSSADLVMVNIVVTAVMLEVKHDRRESAECENFKKDGRRTVKKKCSDSSNWITKRLTECGPTVQTCLMLNGKQMFVSASTKQTWSTVTNNSRDFDLSSRWDSTVLKGGMVDRYPCFCCIDFYPF